MSDPFQDFIKQKKKPAVAVPKDSGHGGRAHSKFAASAMERIAACPGSVTISEGLPDTSNKYSLLGTRAHEILEAIMRIELSGNDGAEIAEFKDALNFRFDPKLEGDEKAQRKEHRNMLMHTRTTADYLLGLGARAGAEVLVEQRVYLKCVHPEAFGTFDGAVLDFFGTLYVFDFKYGEGKGVSPTKNLQMIFYAIALADKYDWNFRRIRMIIDQPRLKGYDGPVYWECSVEELQDVWLPKIRAIVERAEKFPTLYIEGSHCFWCKALKVCPLKNERRGETAKNIFAQAPIQFDDSKTKEYS